METDSSRGCDELNFAEFPLASLSHRAEGRDCLVFTDTIFDRGRGEPVTRTLTISPSAQYGLPTARDDEVILSLLQLTAQAKFTARTVAFTRYQILKLLGWREESKSYERIKQSLFRWLGVTLQYDRAWWCKRGQCWVTKGFHLLEDVQLLDRQRGPGQSSFTWNETVFQSFEDGYLKQIDLAFYRTLESPIAKRLYRFLDKKFHYRRTLEFSLQTLAFEHLGLGRCYHNGELKRLLRGPILELEAKGFVRPKENRFEPVGKGEWTVAFEAGQNEGNRGGAGSSASMESPVSPLAEKLVAAGVSRKAAFELTERFPAERIERQIAAVMAPRRTQKGQPIDNLPGYLVRAIEQDYAAPCRMTPSPKPKRLAANLPARPQPETSPPDVEAEHRRKFWDELTAAEQREFEAAALAQAEGFLARQYHERGAGSLFEAVRWKIIDNHLQRVQAGSERRGDRELAATRPLLHGGSLTGSG